MSRIFSLNPKMAFRFAMAALIALLGFTSCSKTLFSKREKTDTVSDDPSKSDGAPDITIDPTRPPIDRPIRVLYSAPPRTYLWGR